MKWSLDPAHSQIQFAVKHMGISTVRGTFEQFNGTIVEDTFRMSSRSLSGHVQHVTVIVDPELLLQSAHSADEQRMPNFAELGLQRSTRLPNKQSSPGILTTRDARVSAGNDFCTFTRYRHQPGLSPPSPIARAADG